jgi:uroporphyrinogen decarboxylase
MTERELLLRTIRFEKPERIPIAFNINYSCWAHYGQERVRDWVAGHPLLFPWGRSVDWQTFQPYCSPAARAGRPFTDAWGCVWETAQEGILGAVVRHPLQKWEAFDRFVPPDPARTDGLGPVDRDAVKTSIAQTKAEGGVSWGGLVHGHTFLLLTYLRGYENLIFDMMDGEPRLNRLIEMVESFNAGVVKSYLDAGAEFMSYPEDLGMQKGPMISEKLFRQYILPTYKRLMQPAHDAGAPIHMHSDGDLHQLIDPLLECGMTCLNLQDLVNGVDWIAQRLKGRVCIDIDIDRQLVTRSGTPAEIENHVSSLVRQLGSPQGGLMMIYGLYPGIPAANVQAVMDSMERYSTYYS